MYKITSVKLSTIESSKIKPFQQAHLTTHAPLTTHLAFKLTPDTNNGTADTNNSTTAANNGSTDTNNSSSAPNNSSVDTNNGSADTNNGTADTNNGTTDINNGSADVKHPNLHSFNNFAIAFFSPIENTPQSIIRQLINSGLHVLNRKPVIQRNKRQPFFL